MSVISATRIEDVWKEISASPVRCEPRILAVDFRSREGQCWHAIGGGATVAAAIVDARKSCPADATWEAVSWNALYGE